MDPITAKPAEASSNKLKNDYYLLRYEVRCAQLNVSARFISELLDSKDSAASIVGNESNSLLTSIFQRIDLLLLNPPSTFREATVSLPNAILSQSKAALLCLQLGLSTNAKRKSCMDDFIRRSSSVSESCRSSAQIISDQLDCILLRSNGLYWQAANQLLTVDAISSLPRFEAVLTRSGKFNQKGLDQLSRASSCIDSVLEYAKQKTNDVALGTAEEQLPSLLFEFYKLRGSARCQFADVYFSLNQQLLFNEFEAYVSQIQVAEERLAEEETVLSNTQNPNMENIKDYFSALNKCQDTLKQVIALFPPLPPELSISRESSKK